MLGELAPEALVHAGVRALHTAKSSANLGAIPESGPTLAIQYHGSALRNESDPWTTLELVLDDARARACTGAARQLVHAGAVSTGTDNVSVGDARVRNMEITAAFQSDRV
jgi:hypothetical protein